MSQQNNQQQNNNQNQPPQNQPPQRTNPFQRAGNNNNNQSQQNQGTSRFGSGSRFNPPNRKTWTTMPLHRVVVRFEMAGLGDPFYRLLGHELNTDYGEARVVARALEAGGEHVEALAMILDEGWQAHDLKGAAMLYNWNVNNWQTIADPSPRPIPPDQNFFGNNNNDDQEQNQPEEAQREPDFKVLRAIDLQLVLNVLARARSQVLLTTAPLVFSQQYLNRSLVTDDPRLVRLVRATGYLEETYV